MIIDILDNLHRYTSLNSGFALAKEFLSRPDIKGLPVGRHDVDAERVYAIIENTQGRERRDAQLEVHEKYVDIQLVLEGTDTMGWRPRANCKDVATEYQPQADIQFFNDQPEAWLPVQAGMFVIFFPEDAHMPLISPGHLHKLIAKVALEQESPFISPGRHFSDKVLK